MKENLRYWLLSDTHFGHQMLVDKGFRPKDFEELILDGLQGNGEGDVLIHLGDFCMGQDSLWHLNFFNFKFSKRILVRGNHDKKSDTWYYKQGWDFVCDSFTLNKYGKRIIFSHEPIPHHGAGINIHGHWHDNDHRIEPEFRDWYSEDKYKLFSLERTNYKPVPLQEFLNLKNKMSLVFKSKPWYTRINKYFLTKNKNEYQHFFN
jgi:calcineurin-like phosphoesterase family protein